MRDADRAVIDRLTDADIAEVSAQDLLQDRPLLVLAPHPDDESLGCGALLSHAFAGPGAGGRVVCLTDGAASHPRSRAVPPARLAQIRRAEIAAALVCLGGGPGDVTWIGAPDAGLVVTPALVEQVAALARDGGAGLLLAPSPVDPHCDHRAGAALGERVAALVPGLRLGFYPIWSRWHGGGQAPPPPGTTPVRLRPGPFAARKAAAIAAHRSQAGQVVPDDPEGFEMPPGFAAFFATRDEVYFLAGGGLRR